MMMDTFPLAFTFVVIQRSTDRIENDIWATQYASVASSGN